MSRLALVTTMLLALATSASAEKVDWSNYIDKNPSAPLPASKASKTPVVAAADDPPAPAKASKAKKKKAAPKHKTKARPKAKAKHH